MERQKSNFPPDNSLSRFATAPPRRSLKLHRLKKDMFVMVKQLLASLLGGKAQAPQSPRRLYGARNKSCYPTNGKLLIGSFWVVVTAFSNGESVMTSGSYCREQRMNIPMPSENHRQRHRHSPVIPNKKCVKSF